MSGHVAVVTGGASGIGLGVSRRLAADGNQVAVLDLDLGAAEAAAQQIVDEGGTAIGLAADVADRAAVASAYDAVRSQLGPVGIVVTSAGVESFDAAADISAELWDRMIAVNLTGTFTCLQLAIPDMVEAGWGRMVTISSSSAQSGAGRMAHYVAAKGGVISLTKALAKELAPHHVTVNTIPPTVVDTPMARGAEATGAVPPIETLAGFIPLGRAGTPDDIASACSWLCSDGGEYVTGQVIGVNGGMYI
ncbi:MAG: SDR family oxidoreductase [Actinomycetota bacterium]|nr:SDR family oxidoreductase [Actinomycetota bacterium]